MRVWIYRVTDSHGNTDEAATTDPSDDVLLVASDANYKPLAFESEPRHLEGWCDEHRIKLEILELDFDFDCVRIDDWSKRTRSYNTWSPA